MFPQFEIVEDSTTLQSIPPAECSWSIDLLAGLYDSMELSDVVIETKTKELPAHKLILSGKWKRNSFYYLLMNKNKLMQTDLNIHAMMVSR